jgi:hypothetical protein
MIGRAFMVVGLLASPVRADPVTPAVCHPAPPLVAKPASVREIDWCNRDELGGWKGRLRGGRSEVHLYAKLGEPHDTIAAALRGVVYGDLDGDKQLEAAVVIERSTWIERTGAHSASSMVHLYGFAGGAAVRLAELPAGTPVDAITFGGGMVEITSGPVGAKATQRFRRTATGAVVTVPTRP